MGHPCSLVEAPFLWGSERGRRSGREGRVGQGQVKGERGRSSGVVPLVLSLVLSNVLSQVLAGGKGDPPVRSQDRGTPPIEGPGKGYPSPNPRLGGGTHLPSIFSFSPPLSSSPLLSPLHLTSSAFLSDRTPHRQDMARAVRRLQSHRRTFLCYLFDHQRTRLKERLDS